MKDLKRFLEYIEGRKALLLKDGENTDLPHWKMAYNMAYTELDSMVRLGRDMIEREEMPQKNLNKRREK